MHPCTAGLADHIDSFLGPVPFQIPPIYKTARLLLTLSQVAISASGFAHQYRQTEWQLQNMAFHVSCQCELCTLMYNGCGPGLVSCTIMDMTARDQNQARNRLIRWSKTNSLRDDVVISAYECGLTKMEIHRLTNIHRTTIDRIIRSQHQCQTKAQDQVA